MIDIRNITKTFDGVNALDELSLFVPSGSVYGLVGPNGAGKTTAIRHLSGAYKPDSGEVLVNSEPVYENVEVKSKIAYIPDDLYYYSSSTVLDLKKLYQGIYPSFDMERFDRLGGLFSISTKSVIRRLSKGMQKQVFFWVTLCTRPDVIILDEPVDGLDPVMRRGVWSVVLDTVANEGTTVLVSSHNLRELEDVCDHVGMLHKGKMLLERSLSDLQDGIVKVQLAVEGELPELPPMDILSRSVLGRVNTLIIRGSREDITLKLKQLAPLLLDVIPLTLEEIFIYEMGGEHYAVKEILN